MRIYPPAGLLGTIDRHHQQWLAEEVAVWIDLRSISCYTIRFRRGIVKSKATMGSDPSVRGQTLRSGVRPLSAGSDPPAGYRQRLDWEYTGT
jgi:hypothetical protein